MVAVEHVLDLENTVNFDRHTSVLAPYCNCWEAPSAKSDPGSSQAASRGVESPPKSRFVWPSNENLPRHGDLGRQAALGEPQRRRRRTSCQSFVGGVGILAARQSGSSVSRPPQRALKL